MKTIGDEVMVVSPDPAVLTEWAVGLLGRFPERPQPRVGIHFGQAVYRDGDYFGTHVNLAHRVVAARWRRGAGHRPPSSSALGGRGLACEPIGAGRAEGLSRADRALPGPRRAGEVGGMSASEPVMDADGLRRGSRGGLIARRIDGRRDALRRPRLGLHARPRGPALGRRRGHRATRQLRAARGRRRGRALLRRALRRLGSSWRSSARAAPRDPATSRPGPATPATPPRPSSR